MTDDRSDVQRLSDDLRDAFGAVAEARLAPEEHGRWQRRLLAITTTSKRDVRRAREQLDRFRSELAAQKEQRTNDD